MKVTREQQQKTTERLAGASAPPAARPPVIGQERDVEVHRRPVRNPGAPLDLESVRALRVNRSAVERRAATIPTRRTVKKQWQAAWLLRAITCMDLTTLQGDDTPGNVLRLCAKARRPLRDDLVDALGVAHLGLKVGAVCVYHALVPVAAQALAGSGIPVAAVSTGFPAGLRSTSAVSNSPSPSGVVRPSRTRLAAGRSPNHPYRWTAALSSTAPPRRSGTRSACSPTMYWRGSRPVPAPFCSTLPLSWKFPPPLAHPTKPR